MAGREGVPVTGEECGGEFAETDGGLCRSVFHKWRGSEK